MRPSVYSVIFLISFVESRRGGKGGGGEDGPSYSKCNLRLEYWKIHTNGSDYPIPMVATAQLRGQRYASSTLFITRIWGNITFEQQYYRSPVRISGYIYGFMPYQSIGIYVLENGRAACRIKSGKHYNPTNEEHGSSNGCYRHVGDLEAVEADNKGVVDFVQWDQRVQLQGPTSIIGRTVAMLLAPEDNEEENEPRGACGVIAYKHGTEFNQQERMGGRRLEEEPVPVYIWYVGALSLAVSVYLIAKEALRKRSKSYRFRSKNVAFYHNRRVARSRKIQYTSFKNF